MDWKQNDMMIEQEVNQLQKTQLFRGPFFTPINEREKIDFQRKKFQDPLKNPQRQLFTNIMTSFGDLLASGEIGQISKDLISKDCEFLILNTSGSSNSYYHYYKGQEGLNELYNCRKVLKKEITTVNIDTDQKIGIQAMKTKAVYVNETEPKEEITLEIFNFEDGKIKRYRQTRGVFPESSGDPLAKTRKDQILAKIRQINHALVEERLDMEKVASLLHEQTEYKIWSWDNQKFFAFNKKNLGKDFGLLEGNLKIKYIVPYEVFVDTQKGGVGTYSYHLENEAGEEFIWLSTAVYCFDKDLNIVKISQLGELYRNGEIEIPFEVHTREKMIQRMQEVLQVGPDYNLWYNDLVHFDCRFLKIMPEGICQTSFAEGFQQADKLSNDNCSRNKHKIVHNIKETYIDLQDPSYDVAISIVESCPDVENCPLKVFSVSKLSFENGKLAKIEIIICPIDPLLPSPFVEKIGGGDSPMQLEK